MDEEDLADAANSQKLGTSRSFTGVGGRHDDALLTDRFIGLLHVKRETAGALLLSRMGWRDGQGIGPKVNRKPRLESTEIYSEDDAITMGSSHLFAPDDIPMVPFYRKTDRSGLGLHTLDNSLDQDAGKKGAGGVNKSPEIQPFSGSHLTSRTSHGPSSRRGFGVGILNDSSSGEDDPYEIGPRISHIRRVRNQKKRKDLTRVQGAVQVSSLANMRERGECRGEHSPLAGFVRGMTEGAEAVMASQLQGSFPVPTWWTPSGLAAADPTVQTTRTHHPASSFRNLNSSARGHILGEPDTPSRVNVNSCPEPGLVAGSSSQAPQPTRQAAEAALRREQEGRGPYRSQPSKQGRYHRYLEYHTGRSPVAPAKPDGMADLDFDQELAEFYNCVAIFRPMAAPMASRFTAATASAPTTRSTTEIPRDHDDPREAARLGMFGDLTRSILDFTPSGLLCKRFNVTPPCSNASTGARHFAAQGSGTVVPDVGSEVPLSKCRDHPTAKDRETFSANAPSGKTSALRNPTRSDHASEQVFDAIFGDQE